MALVHVAYWKFCFVAALLDLANGLEVGSLAVYPACRCIRRLLAIPARTSCTDEANPAASARSVRTLAVRSARCATWPWNANHVPEAPSQRQRLHHRCGLAATGLLYPVATWPRMVIIRRVPGFGGRPLGTARMHRRLLPPLLTLGLDLLRGSCLSSQRYAAVSCTSLTARTNPLRQYQHLSPCRKKAPAGCLGRLTTLRRSRWHPIV
jgi:hypothetical protein